MLEYWLWLTGRRGVGLRGLRALLEQFGTPEAVYCAAEQGLSAGAASGGARFACR
ncbi:MAG: hypothetical protein ACLU3I_07335 [Acutalibacteraceae bacterium]